MKPGESLTFLRIPGYSWKANEQEHVALVAGGQGITPCYQLARGILRNPADKTRVTLVWGVNTEDDIVLADELAQMEREYRGRFRVVYTVAKPAASSKLTKSFVTKELLQGAGIVRGEKGAGKVFVCGPPAMEKALTGKDGELGKLGYAKGQVHKF